MVLKWTEHIVLTSSAQTRLLWSFNKVQAQIYDKLTQESHQRTISSQASKSFNSNNLQNKQYSSNLSVSINSALPESGGKHRSCAPQQKQQSTSQIVPNETFNTDRYCEKCKQDHSVATCPECLFSSPGYRYQLVGHNNLCTICLSNRDQRQSCPSQKHCQVCSGFHHTIFYDLAKQIKRLTAAFSTEVFLVKIQQLCLVVKFPVKLQLNLLHRKATQTKPPSAALAKLSTSKAS